LHIATHAYFYGRGHAERDAKRKDMAASAEWKAYLSECRPYMQTQQSNIFVEAPLVQQFGEISGLAGMNDNSLEETTVFSNFADTSSFWATKQFQSL
jgi:hypothetical protein